MKVKIAEENRDAEKLLPPAKPDGSRIGVNYADAYIKAFKHTLEDGRAIACKRRGLKITLAVGDRKGEALMRRIDHGPDAKVILQKALSAAARAAGAALLIEDGVIWLEIDA